MADVCHLPCLPLFFLPTTFKEERVSLLSLVQPRGEGRGGRVLFLRSSLFAVLFFINLTMLFSIPSLPYSYVGSTLPWLGRGQLRGESHPFLCHFRTSRTGLWPHSLHRPMRSRRAGLGKCIRPGPCWESHETMSLDGPDVCGLPWGLTANPAPPDEASGPPTPPCWCGQLPHPCGGRPFCRWYV